MNENTTLTQIEESLPNGFHDALIERVFLDYVERKIVFTMRLWVGDCSSENRDDRETYRNGVLTISQFLLCVVEPPDPRYPWAEPKALRVSSGAGNPQDQPFLQDLPAGTFSHWFFVNEWNSFIYVVAKGARLMVSDEVEVDNGT